MFPCHRARSPPRTRRRRPPRVERTDRRRETESPPKLARRRHHRIGTMRPPDARRAPDPSRREREIRGARRNGVSRRPGPRRRRTTTRACSIPLETGERRPGPRLGRRRRPGQERESWGRRRRVSRRGPEHFVCPLCDDGNFAHFLAGGRDQSRAARTPASRMSPAHEPVSWSQRRTVRRRRRTPTTRGGPRLHLQRRAACAWTMGRSVLVQGTTARPRQRFVPLPQLAKSAKVHALTIQSIENDDPAEALRSA